MGQIKPSVYTAKSGEKRTLTQIQQFARNLLEPPPYMEPVQQVAAVLAKPADDSTKSVVTLYSNRGLAVLSFQYCPHFNCKVIALKSRIFVVKSRTKFAMKFVRDLNAKDTSVGDGGHVRPSALCPRFEYKDALKSAI